MSAGPEVAVVGTGIANLASVLAALERAGATPRVVDAPDEVSRAARVLLPGVGAFGAGMQALVTRGLVEPLRERAAAGRPLLGICLGMQLFAQASAESPGTAGLGLLPAAVAPFPDGVQVPQFGWNRVAAAPGAAVLGESGWCYFANSYRLQRAPDGWSVAWAEHGGPFVAALERGAVVGCQFHPELSGAFGARLLRRWLEQTAPVGGWA